MNTTTILIIALAIYSAAMTYLRATAKATKTTLDDKALEYGEKAEPIVDLIKAKVDADEALKAAAKKA